MCTLTNGYFHLAWGPGAKDKPVSGSCLFFENIGPAVAGSLQRLFLAPFINLPVVAHQRFRYPPASEDLRPNLDSGWGEAIILEESANRAGFIVQLTRAAAARWHLPQRRQPVHHRWHVV